MGKLWKFALVPTAEVNWVSKLPAASKPAGSNLWPSLPTTFLKTRTAGHLSHTVVQDTVEQALLGKQARGQFIPAIRTQNLFLDWASACAVWTIHQGLFLQKALCELARPAYSPTLFSIFTPLCFRMFCSLPLVFLSSLWPFSSPQHPSRLSLFTSLGKTFFACHSFLAFLCVPCNTGAFLCCSIDTEL